MEKKQAKNNLGPNWKILIIIFIVRWQWSHSVTYRTPIKKFEDRLDAPKNFSMHITAKNM